jgi:hypothetical protein
MAAKKSGGEASWGLRWRERVEQLPTMARAFRTA